MNIDSWTHWVKKPHLLALALYPLLTTALTAGDITWNVRQLTADTDINKEGKLIEATYFNGPVTSREYPGKTKLSGTITVNAVPFQATDFSSGRSLRSMAGLTYSGGEYGHTGAATGHLALADGIALRSGQPQQAGTLQELEVGSSYAIQIIYYHATANRTVTIAAVGDQTRRGVLSELGVPVIATGTFVADAKTKALSFVATGGSQYINAYQLRRIDAPDRDSDGIPDSFESANMGLDPNDPSDAAGDVDADGSSNLEEYNRGTGVGTPDSDGDGRNDGDEIGIARGGTDPLDPDTDDDGISDGDELSNANGFVTNPVKWDTDRDTFPDAYEIRVDSDPTDAGNIPAITPTWVTPSDLDEARKRARLANQGFDRTNRYMDGWLARRHGRSMLIPDGQTRYWLPENSGADNYPFMVLAAWGTDPTEFGTSVLDMLNSEIANTSRSLGEGKPAIMPDHFYPGRHVFRYSSPEVRRMTFASSEYMKDGLITLTELMGPADNPWYDRMLQIMDYMWMNEANRPSDHAVGIIDPSASQADHFSSEAHGENLQVLPRLYWQTGRKKYLEWAIRLGDHYLLDGPEHAESFHPTHGAATEIWLVDHGNEIISGLVELYVTLRVLADNGDSDAQAKVTAYQPRIYLMLDYCARFGFDENGITHRRITTATSDNPGTVIPQVLNYAYAYLYYAYYMMFQIDKDSPDPKIAAKAQGYRDMTRSVLANLPAKHIDMIGHEDSFEGTLTLYNKEPDVPGVKTWLDNEAQRMFAQQKSDGQFRRAYSDGNFGRSMLMFALWKTCGVRTDAWHSGLEFGSVETDGGLLLVVRSNGAVWKGSLIFDQPRHREFLHMPIDTTRINKFPEWYTVDPENIYHVTPVGGSAQAFTGRKLINGIRLSLVAGEEKVFLISDKVPAGGMVFVRNP